MQMQVRVANQEREDKSSNGNVVQFDGDKDLSCFTS